MFSYFSCKFGQLGPGKGQFNSPHGFCLGLEEEIIVADTNNHRIQVFEKNGTYRYQFGVAGKEEGQLWYPRSVHIRGSCLVAAVVTLGFIRKVAVMKSSGKFVVCDRGNERSRMQIFSKHGHFVRLETSPVSTKPYYSRKYRRKIAIRYIDIVAGLAITREGNIGVCHVKQTLIIKFPPPSCRGLSDPDHLRHPGTRGAPALV